MYQYVFIFFPRSNCNSALPISLNQLIANLIFLFQLRSSFYSYHNQFPAENKMFNHSKLQNTLLALSYVSLASAAFNCDAHVNGISFNLSPLNGTHQLSSKFSTPPSTSEYIWVFDPCGLINRDNKEIAGLDQCPQGSQSMYIYIFNSVWP